MSKRNNCGNLPKQSSFKNAKAWLIGKGYIARDGETVLDYKGLVNLGLPAIRERGLSLGYQGDVGTFSNRGQHFYLSEMYFNDIDNGVKNVGQTSPEFTNNPSLSADLAVTDMVLEEISDNVVDTIFNDDYALSDQALMEQEEDIDDEEHYAAITFDHATLPPITPLEPVNFGEWVRLRHELLERLDRQKNSLLKQRAPKEEIAYVNEAITKLEEELSNISPNSVGSVHHHVLEEIEIINNVLDLAKDDAPGAAKALVYNEIQDRLDKLDSYFRVTTDTESPGYVTSYHLNRGLNEYEVTALRGKISNLVDKYNSTLSDIVTNIVNNSDNMLIAKQTKTPEEFAEYQQAIRSVLDPNFDPETGIDTFRRKKTLGAKSYGDVLLAVLSVERDVAANREAGITQGWIHSLGEAWKKLRDVKTVDGEYITDYFFIRNEFGQKTSRLIPTFTSKYYAGIAAINALAKNFAKAKPNRKASIYKIWMRKLQSQADFVDLTKLKSVAKEFGNHPDFAGLFETDQAEMDRYEKELRDKLGPTAYDIEVQKQIEGLRNYLSDSFISDDDKYSKNPLRFLRHFYSDESGNPDPTTGLFLQPSYHYIKFIPNLSTGESVLDPTFESLESSLGDDFREFYSNAHHLLEYSRAIFEGERALGNKDIKMDINDVISIKESYNTELARQLGFFSSIYVETAEWFSNIVKRFSTATFQDKKVRKYEDISFKTHFSSYGRKDQKVLTELYKKKSTEELVKKAKSLGIKVIAENESVFLQAGEAVHNKMAEAIAHEIVNKQASLDIHKRIVAGAKLAESIKARRTALGLGNLFNSYFQVNNKKAEADYLLTYTQLNITQEGILKTDSAVSNIERRKIWKNSLTKAEKEIKSMLKEEKRSNENDEITDYDFFFNGSHYYFDDIMDYIKEDEDGNITAMTQESMKEAYNMYLKETINNLGRRVTVGTVVGGTLSNFRSSALSLNPASGITNREAGMHQNNQAAASGLYGFNIDDLTVARRFLFGARTANTVEYAPWLAKLIGLRHYRRHKQWKVLEHLAENLRLLENVMGDLDLGDGTVIKKGAWKNFLSDFAVNNAEYHNQMEILVSMMINTKIEKINSDGTISEVPLFDPKTMRFPIDPDTKKLKAEYRTPNNISNWEKFDKSEEGKVEHTALATRYQALKHRLHGNYDSNDKIAMEATVTGRAAIAFQKWFFENVENEWGGKKVDYVTGEIDVKGRKIVLAQHFPTMMLHLGLQNVFTSSKFMNKMAAILIGLGGFSVIATPATVAATVGVGLLPLLYFKRKDIFSAKNFSAILNKTWKTISFQNKALSEKSKNELLLMMSYTAEILARTLRTTIASSTGIPVIKEKHIKAMSFMSSPDSLGHRNLSEKERAIISENAQQIADKMSSMFRYLMIGAATKFMYVLATVGPDDDEEEKLKQLEKLEGFINFLINKSHQTRKELETMTNPSSLVDTLRTRVFLDWLTKTMEEIASIKDVKSGDKTFDEVMPNFLGGIAKATLGVPKTAVDVILKGKNPFSNDKIYDGDSVSALDKKLVDSYKPEEQVQQEDVEKKTRKISKNIGKYLRANLEDKLESEGIELSEDQKDKIVNANRDKIMKTEKLRFKDKSKVNWSEVGEDLDVFEVSSRYRDYDIDINLKGNSPRKASSSRGSSRSSSRSSKRTSSSRSSDRSSSR